MQAATVSLVELLSIVGGVLFGIAAVLVVEPSTRTRTRVVATTAGAAIVYTVGFLSPDVFSLTPTGLAAVPIAASGPAFVALFRIVAAVVGRGQSAPFVAANPYLRILVIGAVGTELIRERLPLTTAQLSVAVAEVLIVVAAARTAASLQGDSVLVAALIANGLAWMFRYAAGALFSRPTMIQGAIFYAVTIIPLLLVLGAARLLPFERRDLEVIGLPGTLPGDLALAQFAASSVMLILLRLQLRHLAPGAVDWLYNTAYVHAWLPLVVAVAFCFALRYLRRRLDAVGWTPQP